MMPTYMVQCDKCSLLVAILQSGKWAPKPCDNCGGQLVRVGKGPTTRVVERLDNGTQPRAVERLRDAEEIHAERALNADDLAGK